MQMPTGVVMRRTATLVPYPNNARTHTPEQKVKQIAASAWTRYRASSEEGFDLSLMGLG
jgi:hypothetical protein